MENRGEARLETAAIAVADGTPLEWSALASELAPFERDVIDQMRVIARIAETHRRPRRHGKLGLATCVADGDISSEELKRFSHLVDKDFLEALQVIAQLGSEHSGQPLTDSADVLTRWGPLELRDKIAEGGFGVVYKAYDAKLERDLAVKLMRASRSSAEVIDEARLMARVRHPNVVTVFGADSFDGVVGIWMEFVEGRSLEQIIRTSGPYGAREALLIGIDVARALAAVHAAGLIHSDIKAQNVMRAAGGRTVLMDFGAGREVLANAEDRVMAIAGTPLYMAPEVLLSGQCSVQSDVYSLGVLLDHLVSGSFPVDAQTISDVRDAHRNQRRRLLRDARPDLPAPFIEVVERAMAWPRDERYASAGAVETALTKALRECDAAPEEVKGNPPSTSRRRALRTLGAAIAALMVLASAAVVWNRTTPITSPITSVAVLPLENESSSAELDYFAEGMTDLLTTNLSKIRPLRVTSPTSAARFAGYDGPDADIASQLQVQGIIRGGVSLNGNRVRVSLRIIHAGTNDSWRHSYERELTHVGSLQAEIVRDVARRMNVRLTPQEQRGLVTTPAAVSPEAQDAYFRGRHYQNLTSREGAEKAIAYYEEANRLDPNYAPPYAALATSYIMMNAFGVLSIDQTTGRARAAVERGLALDDQIPEVHVALGDIYFLHEWNWRDAEASYRRAIELNPSYAYAYAEYAWFLAARVRLDEALDAMRHAEELDPLSLLMKSNVAGILYYDSQFDAAIAKCQEILRIDPTFGIAHRRLMQLYAEKGLLKEALASGTRVLSITGSDPGSLADFARVQALAGNVAAAERIVADLRAPAKIGRIVSADRLAFVYAALGNRDAALELLQRAIDERAPNIPWLAVDPHYNLLRHDPRFPALLRQLQLPE
jgi:serine/threonine protein kinase/tetratricopeptide (TPR) repeat protein